MGNSSHAGQQAGHTGQADDVTTCLCEGVFGLSQLALALALPLALLAWSEVRARRQFAAAERYRQQEAQLARVLGSGGIELQQQSRHMLPSQQQHRQQPIFGVADAACADPPGWFITYDRMRLVLALALIEVRSGQLAADACQRGDPSGRLVTLRTAVPLPLSRAWRK